MLSLLAVATHVAAHESSCLAFMIEGFEAVCIGGKLSIDGQAHVPHSACKSTGTVPTLPGLRADCPGVLEYNGPCYVGDPQVPQSEWWRCGCQGRSWRAMTDYDTVTAAIRENGWEINVYSCPDWSGDWVIIAENQNGIPGKQLGVVKANEGLRGTAAIFVALLRTLMALPDNDPKSEWYKESERLLA